MSRRRCSIGVGMVEWVFRGDPGYAGRALNTVHKAADPIAVVRSAKIVGVISPAGSDMLSHQLSHRQAGGRPKARRMSGLCLLTR